MTPSDEAVTDDRAPAGTGSPRARLRVGPLASLASSLASLLGGRGRRARWLGLALGAASIFAVGANALVRRSAGPYLYRTAVELPPHGVAIVPGASVHRDGTPSPQLEERLAAALVLLKLDRVDAVLVSGAHRGAYDEAGAMRHWLIQHGAPADLVFEDHSGFRTLDTMARAVQTFRVRRAIVCTQAFHLPRAVFLARRAGIDALGMTADESPRTTGPNDSVREWFARVMAVIDTYVLHRGPRETSLPTPIAAGAS